MTLFERQLDAVLNELGPVGFQMAKPAFKSPFQGITRSPLPTTQSGPDPKMIIAKFSGPPYHVHPEDMQALIDDPEDSEAFYHLCSVRGKPIAGMVRKAALGQSV